MQETGPYHLPQYRADIRAAEVGVAAIRPGASPDQALALLELLDHIDATTVYFDARGVDLRSEKTQIESIHRTLLAKHQQVLKMLRRIAPLPELRAVRGIEEGTPWWWYLDRHAAAVGAREVRRALWLIAGAAALIGVLALLYVLFLRPDEATRLRYGYTMDAERQIEAGDYARALELYRQAAGVAPQDPELQLMIGVMYEALEEPAQAAEAYARAEALYETPAFFWASKSQQYNTLGWYERGVEAAQQAIDLDPEFPFAYCALGGSYEGQDRIRDAIGALQQCADLAREQEQNELYVIATSRLAMLMQMPLPTPTPLPATQ